MLILQDRSFTSLQSRTLALSSGEAEAAQASAEAAQASAEAARAAARKRRNSRASAAPTWPRLSSGQVKSYLTFFGDGSAECDGLHASLSDSVLDVYISWHLPGGRLESQMPDGATNEQLRAAKSASFRLPFEVLISVASFCTTHPNVMRVDTGTVSVPCPGGQRDRSSLAAACVSTSHVEKAMTGLREWPGCKAFADEPVIATAYLQTWHELGQHTGRNAQPLDETLRNAILRQCNLAVPRDVVLATWVVNAPLLMQRTCESLTVLHADLACSPCGEAGAWHVPGFTKTTDGVEGCVPLWRHHSLCLLAKYRLHEALELPIEKLRAAACGRACDDRLAPHLACPVCLVWLSRRLQGLSASERDGPRSVYQEVDAHEAFTGRLVDPEVLLQDFRTKMKLADAERLAAGLHAFPDEGRTLYAARHGGIMDYLVKGHTPEWVAERARIPVSTLLRYYRRHNIIKDPFESNGQFTRAQIKLVVVRAHEDGFLATEADVRLLLNECGLTLEDAVVLPRTVLFSHVAKVVASDVRHTSAAAALLRSTHIRSDLAFTDRAAVDVSEDVELSPAALCALLVEASHDNEERARSTFTALEAEAEHALSLMDAPAADVGIGPEARHLGLSSTDRTIVADRPVQLAAARSLSINDSLVSSAHLSDSWHLLATRCPKVRALFDRVRERGLRVAACPAAAALELASDSARLLPTTLAYNWAGAHGWCLGEIVACNDNPHALLNSVPLNFIAAYDDDPAAEHALCICDYGSTGVNGWLLFERVDGSQTNGELPVRTLPSKESARRVQSLATERPARSSRQETLAKIASVAAPNRDATRTPAELVVRPSDEPPSNRFVTTRAGGALRARAIFARASLHGQALPPVPLLLCTHSEAHAAVVARLEEQAVLTGTGQEALRVKMAKVCRLDLYVQAASAGHMGLIYGSHIGGQLWTLSAKPSFLAIMFLDMGRIHGGDKGFLAFPRGGYQAHIKARVTRGEARQLLTALGMPARMPFKERQQAAIELNARRGDDPTLAAGEAVLNAVFARLVCELHAEGGVFESDLPAITFEEGLGKLRVGSALVKEVATSFMCGPRWHAMLAKGPLSESVGQLNEGPYSRDASGNTIKFSADTVRTYKSVLSWWLRRNGWPSKNMPKRGRRNAYVSVVQLEMPVVRKAYYTVLRRCEEQKLHRAMAATEDVMQQLLTMLVVSVALDLTMMVAMCLSYALGLRVSDVHLLDRNNFRYGVAEERADVEFVLDRHKGDGNGEGFCRWLQHCHRCEFEYLSAAGNQDGRAWSVRSAATYQCTNNATPAARCHVCMLLMMLAMQGDAPHDAPLFREMAPGEVWSWQRLEFGSASSFSEERMRYRSFNARLRQLLLRVNAWRAGKGLVQWVAASFHWHMFRHGHVIMALVFNVPVTEILRSLRMLPSTLQAYRAHVSSAFGSLLDVAQTHCGVQERARSIECNALAVAAVGPGADCTVLRCELELMCATLHVSSSGLRHLRPAMRQLVIHGAAARSLLSIRFVVPLLAELQRTDGERTAQPAANVELPTSQHITNIEAPLLSDAALDVAVQALPDDEHETATQISTSDGATQVGDNVTADVGNLHDLEEAWHLLHHVAQRDVQCEHAALDSSGS